MTPHKHAAVIHAWADGASIEFKNTDGNWVPMSTPGFYPEYEYRVKSYEYRVKSIEYRVKRTEYSIGNTFCRLNSDFLLAQVQTFKVCLICLETGNRFKDPVSVCDPRRITEEEFEKIVDGNTFKKL